ncbi:hypothetical protein [Sphingomonas sp. SRS2]|nr:hypothetical protein [Sphingomonas sp. SRS2]
MSGVEIFFGAVAVGLLILVAVIARDVSEIADRMHELGEGRRHG